MVVKGHITAKRVRRAQVLKKHIDANHTPIGKKGHPRLLDDQQEQPFLVTNGHSGSLQRFRGYQIQKPSIGSQPKIPRNV